jgi:hypothetical protein
MDKNIHQSQVTSTTLFKYKTIKNKKNNKNKNSCPIKENWIRYAITARNFTNRVHNFI